MDPFRKLTEEEKRKWEKIELAVASVGMLAILFVAAAGSAIDQRYQKEQEQQQEKTTIPVEAEKPDTSAKDTLIIKAEQFKR